MGVLDGVVSFCEEESDSEYFDAFENEEELVESTRKELSSTSTSSTVSPSGSNNNVAAEELLAPSFDDLRTRIPGDHPRRAEIRQISSLHVEMAGVELDDWGAGGDGPGVKGVGPGVKVQDGWTVIAREGEMVMYSKEFERDGVVLDPLKAVHTIAGVTGHEMCHYFYDMRYRKDWDHTVEKSQLVESIADDVVVQHQVHRRIWPAAARDAVFWSHLTHHPGGGRNVWSVSNYSTTHPRAPKVGKNVRVHMNVCLVCETFLKQAPPGGRLTRNDVTCKVTYSATVHPGGWAPPAILRQVYKKEYPKFLRKFTKYVIEQTRNKEMMF